MFLIVFFLIWTIEIWFRQKGMPVINGSMLASNLHNPSLALLLLHVLNRAVVNSNQHSAWWSNNANHGRPQIPSIFSYLLQNPVLFFQQPKVYKNPTSTTTDLPMVSVGTTTKTVTTELPMGTTVTTTVSSQPSTISPPKCGLTLDELRKMDLFENQTNRLPSKLTRIVGGEQTPISDIPWQVSIQLVQLKRKRVGEDLKHFCGGSIINSNWIITAAHCFDWLVIWW